MAKKKNLFKKLAFVFGNKYVLVTILLAVWVVFFDKNDLLSQLALTGKYNDLKLEKQYYLNEIAENKKRLEELKTNKVSLEKFAREQYLMKKDNEDVFVIVNPSAKK